VEDGEHLELAGALHGAVQARDADIRLQDELRGEVPQRHQELGIDGARLLAQVRRAQLDLLGTRVAVSGRAALQHVRDEHVLADEPGDGQQLVEVLARRAHEGLALQVFVLARRLADDHDACFGIAHAEHRLRAAVGQGALAAPFHLRAYLVERNMRLGHANPLSYTYTRGMRKLNPQASS